MKKKLVVLTGAGISAESGIQTFRDTDGLWEGHSIDEVATPEGWQKNPKKVLDFYNQRRAQLKEVKPNKAHEILAAWESDFEVTIITQNVDDLHERAGSTHIIHLHGSLISAKSEKEPTTVLPWHDDIKLGDTDENGVQLRPDIVWFGEAVPMYEKAVTIVEKADVVLIVGTSMQVYPAAGLFDYAPKNIPVIYVDPNPPEFMEEQKRIFCLAQKATDGLEFLKDYFKKSS